MADAGAMADDREHLEAVYKVLRWLALGRDLDFYAKNNCGLCAEALQHVDIPAYITLNVISRLRSVLVVDEEIALKTQLRASHASFPQFLTDNARCQDPTVFVQAEPAHVTIAKSLLDFMCRVTSETLENALEMFPFIWVYARYEWAYRLRSDSYSDDIRQSLPLFVSKYLDNQIRREILREGSEEMGIWWQDTGPPKCITEVRAWSKASDIHFLMIVGLIMRFY